MFCPPGYTPLSEFLPRWNEKRREAVLRGFEYHWWNGQFSKAVRAAAGLEALQAVDLKTEIRDFFALAPADESEQKFFDLVEDNLFTASPEGQVSRLDPGLIYEALGDFVVTPRDLWKKAKVLGRTDLMDPWHGETGLLDHGLLNAFRLTSLTWERMAAELTGARAADPKATPWQVARQLKSVSLHHTLAPFHERIGYTLSLQGYDLAEELGIDCTSLVHELADRIRPLQGRALCMPTAIAEVMLSTQPFRAESQQLRHTPKFPGRPRSKRDKLLDAYLENFPNGHGGMSLGKLLNILLPKTDLKSASVQTLARMLEEL